jgi:hypothetical protein
LASLPDDRRLLLALELSDGGDERQSFPAIDVQDIDILSLASIENSERQSFPEPEFRNGDMRDDRWLFLASELRDEDDER